MLPTKIVEQELMRAALVVERAARVIASSKKPLRAFLSFYVANVALDAYESITGARFERIWKKAPHLKVVP